MTLLLYSIPLPTICMLVVYVYKSIYTRYMYKVFMKSICTKYFYTVISNIHPLFQVKVFIQIKQKRHDTTNKAPYLQYYMQQTSHTKQKRHKKTTLDSSKDKNKSNFETFLSGISLSCRRAELSPLSFRFTPLSSYFIFSENSNTNPRFGILQKSNKP